MPSLTAEPVNMPMQPKPKPATADEKKPEITAEKAPAPEKKAEPAAAPAPEKKAEPAAAPAVEKKPEAVAPAPEPKEVTSPASPPVTLASALTSKKSTEVKRSVTYVAYAVSAVAIG